MPIVQKGGQADRAGHRSLVLRFLQSQADGEGGSRKFELSMPRRVLIADDDADIRAFVRAWLAPDFDVIEADSGLAALAAAETRLIDVAVLDVMMPGLTGVDVCRRLKRRKDAPVSVILLTALDSEEARAKGFDAGADAYLTKPVKGTQLRELVGRLSRGASAST